MSTTIAYADRVKILLKKNGDPEGTSYCLEFHEIDDEVSLLLPLNAEAGTVAEHLNAIIERAKKQPKNGSSHDFYTLGTEGDHNCVHFVNFVNFNHGSTMVFDGPARKMCMCGTHEFIDALKTLLAASTDPSQPGKQPTERVLADSWLHKPLTDYLKDKFANRPFASVDKLEKTIDMCRTGKELFLALVNTHWFDFADCLELIFFLRVSINERIENVLETKAPESVRQKKPYGDKAVKQLMEIVVSIFGTDFDADKALKHAAFVYPNKTLKVVDQYYGDSDSGDDSDSDDE